MRVQNGRSDPKQGPRRTLPQLRKTDCTKSGWKEVLHKLRRNLQRRKKMAKTKVTMPDDLKSKCAAVIHTATTAAAAAGVIPIPMADTIPITAAQITMIIGLGHIFDISLSETAAKSILVWYDGKPDRTCCIFWHYQRHSRCRNRCGRCHQCWHFCCIDRDPWLDRCRGFL